MPVFMLTERNVRPTVRIEGIIKIFFKKRYARGPFLYKVKKKLRSSLVHFRPFGALRMFLNCERINISAVSDMFPNISTDLSLSSWRMSFFFRRIFTLKRSFLVLEIFRWSFRSCCLQCFTSETKRFLRGVKSPARLRAAKKNKII